MFRASSAHLQEDTVVYMQHMVLSLCKQVSGRVLLKHDFPLCWRYYCLLYQVTVAFLAACFFETLVPTLPYLGIPQYEA
jgi:hypothetical protein